MADSFTVETVCERTVCDPGANYSTCRQSGTRTFSRNAWRLAWNASAWVLLAAGSMLVGCHHSAVIKFGAYSKWICLLTGQLQLADWAPLVRLLLRHKGGRPPMFRSMPPYILRKLDWGGVDATLQGLKNCYVVVIINHNCNQNQQLI